MRVVGKHGAASIVEYECDGVLRRCMLPKEIIREYGLSIPDQILDRGIEIGVDVEEAIDKIVMPTPTDLLNDLREQGFWTSDDVLASVTLFRRALIASISDQITMILREIR